MSPDDIYKVLVEAGALEFDSESDVRAMASGIYNESTWRRGKTIAIKNNI